MSAVGGVRLLLGTFLILCALLSAKLVLAESQSGSVGLSGKVVASAPSEAPVISVPADQSHFEESPITVSGICETDLLIKIYINEIFSGSVMCVNSKFSLEVDLFAGENEIVARAYDNLDQAGPDSKTVTVYFDASISDLRLTSDYARQSVDPREILTWPVTIAGGSAPYAVSIDWGDGRTSLKSLLKAGEFEIEHAYLYSGIYKVVVRAVDVDGNRTVLQLVAVSKGVSTAPSTEPASDKPKEVVLIQPMVIFITFMISTFWLGKRYERKRLQE